MSDWNHRFTRLLRQSRPNFWGNWALASQVTPGAVGFVDPATGAFKLVSECLPGAAFIETPTSSSWKLSSEGVSRHKADVKGKGSITDPHTGIQITPEIEFVWTFDKKDSLTSEFAVVKECTLKNLGALTDKYEWLLNEATKVGFARGDKIAQGFGVVTQVIYAKSGVNLGARDRGASYTMGGSANGLHAMLGEAGPQASAKGTYSYSRETHSLDKHVWPAQAGTSTTDAVPLAFAFSSFEGRIVLPAWRGRVEELAIHLDSKASRLTTYTTKAKLTYLRDGKPHSPPVIVIPGGLSGTFAGIPLDAKDVRLELTFVGLINDSHQVFNWDIPLAQWPVGKMHIDLSGTWPGSPKAVIREDLNRGV